MASTLVQFRTEDSAKATAISICDKLGIDLQSYLRMCISRLIQENGIPFSMNVNDIPVNKGIKAMRAASEISAKNGDSNMSLEEINREISSTRKKIKGATSKTGATSKN